MGVVFDSGLKNLAKGDLEPIEIGYRDGMMERNLIDDSQLNLGGVWRNRAAWR
jgi:hypothetical protein